jgi:hypothetical protein
MPTVIKALEELRERRQPRAVLTENSQF